MNFIPIQFFLQQPEPKCPKCGQDEDVKQVCKHCGYEYEEESGLSFGDVLLLVFIVIGGAFLFLWLVWTFITWFDHENLTLLDVLKNQGEYLIRLSKRVY
jgi:hypothetical protein